MSASNFTGPVPAPKDTQTPLNVFITGASRGIGLELTRQYAAANAKSQIFAGVRDAKAAGVVALVKEFPNVVPIVQDASSDASIHASVQEVEKRVHSLDILINNAGIAGKAGGVFKETRANFAHVLDTNVAGVLIITQSFLPLLRKSTLKVPARVLNVSSGLGSIALQANLIKYFGADNSSIAYNISKAALNCLTADFAASEPSIIFTAASPGWVDTDMGSNGGKASPPVKVADCAQALRALVESLSSDQSGSFVDNIEGGKVIPY